MLNSELVVQCRCDTDLQGGRWKSRGSRAESEDTVVLLSSVLLTIVTLASVDNDGRQPGRRDRIDRLDGICLEYLF